MYTNKLFLVAPVKKLLGMFPIESESPLQTAVGQVQLNSWVEMCPLSKSELYIYGSGCAGSNYNGGIEERPSVIYDVEDS